MKINFIISNWGNAHQLSRATHLEERYDSAIYFGFLRNIYPTNKSINFKVLGKLRPGYYSNRLLVYIRSVIILIKDIKRQELIYVFGLDNLISISLVNLFFARRWKLVYEISDVREILIKRGLFSSCLRVLDGFFIKRCMLVVTTSSQFIEDYYLHERGLMLKNYIELENKVHPVAGDLKTTKNDKLKIENRIVVGYFGMIRCQRSLELIKQLQEKSDRFYFIFRGVLMPSVKERWENDIMNIPNSSFLGSYNSPENLAYMYNEIDMSWIMYPFSEKKIGNWKWAKTNRYYEAGYYKTPMIASENTQDAIRVTKLGTGIALDLLDINGSLAVLMKLCRNDLLHYTNNLESLDRSLFEVTNDYDILAERIKEKL